MARDSAVDGGGLPGVVLMADAAIAVNLLWCVPGDVGGSEEYLVRQLLGLAEASPELRPTLYVVDGFAQAHPDVVASFPTVVASFDRASRPRRVIGELTWFRTKTPAADLRHHGGGTAPPAAGRPYVLTIHALQYRTYPRYFTRTKRTYLAAVMGRSAHKARIVAVPSDYVRQSVIDAFKVDEAKVHVVPHGVERDRLVDATAEDELRQRYSLGDGPVIVYPAVTNPHKNHRFLIDLMGSKWRDPGLRLVLTGGSGAAEAAVSAAATDPRIRRVGRVSDADRNGLLKMADAMTFP